MKKALSVLAVIAVVFAGCSKKEKSYTVALGGIVNFTFGQAFIKSASGVETAAKPGDSVSEGMTVTTKGAKSILDIYVGENVIRLVGDSSVVFDKLVKDMNTSGETVAVTVSYGKSFNRIVKKLSKEDSYQVKSGNVVAAVRGTEFFVSSESGKTNVACLDGKVAVSDGAGREVIIEKNEQVDASGSDIVKKQIEADELNKMKLLTDIKQMQDDIRKTYENQKSEILKSVTDQKEKDKQAVENQKSTDAANIEAVKQTTAAAIESAKGNTESKEAASAATSDAQSKMTEAKNVDTNSVLDAVKKQKEAMKQQTNTSGTQK